MAVTSPSNTVRANEPGANMTSRSMAEEHRRSSSQGQAMKEQWRDPGRWSHWFAEGAPPYRPVTGVRAHAPDGREQMPTVLCGELARWAALPLVAESVGFQAVAM